MAQQQNTFLGKLMARIGENLGLLKDRSSRLQSQQRAATATLEKARAALQSHLLDGDDDDSKIAAALQTKIDTAASLLASLDAAVAEQGRRVADAEREMAAEQAKASCKAASEKIAADVEKIERQLPIVLAAMRALAADLNVYETFRFEAGAIAKFAINAANEIEIALSVTVPDLKGGVIAVRDSKEKPPMPPATVVKFVAPKAPPTETVFFLRASKWSDETGKLHLIQKFSDASLPPSLAAHAIKVGAAVEWRSPLRKQNRGTWNGRPFHAEHCFALDEASANSPIVHSAFEPHPNVGAPYTIKAAPVALAVGARNMPPTDKE